MIDSKTMLYQVPETEFKLDLLDKIQIYLDLANKTLDDNRQAKTVESLQYYLQKKQFKNLSYAQYCYVFEQGSMGKWSHNMPSFQTFYGWFKEYLSSIQQEIIEDNQKISEKNTLSLGDNNLFARAMTLKVGKMTELKKGKKIEAYERINKIPVREIYNRLKKGEKDVLY